MIPRNVAGQQVHAMTRMEDDPMIYACAPDAADEPLDRGRLPRRPWRRDHILDPDMPHLLLKRGTVDGEDGSPPGKLAAPAGSSPQA